MIGLLVVFGFGIIKIADMSVDHQTVHDDAIVKAITDRYAIDSVGGLDALHATLISSESAVIDELCAPVSLSSPELSGVVDGQQIRFRVGITDCTGDPTAEIIVTETPGQNLMPKQLEK